NALSTVRIPSTSAEDATLACVELPETDLRVQGDRDYLERLFINLLENALRHTPADGRVRVSATPKAGQAVITSQNTGEGSAPDHLPHLCERFYRVDAARSRMQGGTGLGLAICKSIVEAHGGTLHIDSHLGQGTRVQVTLPQANRANENPS